MGRWNCRWPFRSVTRRVLAGNHRKGMGGAAFCWIGPFFAIAILRALLRTGTGRLSARRSSRYIQHFDTALPVIQLHNCISVSFRASLTWMARTAHISLRNGYRLCAGRKCRGARDCLFPITALCRWLYPPGQTEFIAERCGCLKKRSHDARGADLRVVPMTKMIPLAESPESLTASSIRHRIRATAKGLQRNFGIAHPD